MNRTPALLLGCAMMMTSALAAEPKSIADIKVGIADAVSRYANSIACRGVKVQAGDVHLLDAGQFDSHLPKYAVLWTGDLGCFGGSGTEGTHLAIATVNTGQYVVQPQLSSPVVRFESPVRFVSRVVSATGDTLVLEGREYKTGDPQSNPSIPVRFALRAAENGDWKLVEKNAMASNR